MNVNLPIAFIAGIVSFLSPCIFPLIPSYLGFIGAATYDQGFKRNKGGIFTILSFILGFTIIFMIMGILFSTLGVVLQKYSIIINRVSGSIVTILGLNIIFSFIKFLDYEKKPEIKVKNKNIFTSLLIGMAFGAGWSPCIGPILASILFLAGNSSTYLDGVMLLISYSIGLGIPFFISGVFISKFQDKTRFIKKNLSKIRVLSGVLLILIGLLIFSGKLWNINELLSKTAIGFSKIYDSFTVVINAILGVLLLLPLLNIKKIIEWQNSTKKNVTIAIISVMLIISILSFSGFINWKLLVNNYLSFQGI